MSEFPKFNVLVDRPASSLLQLIAERKGWKWNAWKSNGFPFWPPAKFTSHKKSNAIVLMFGTSLDGDTFLGWNHEGGSFDIDATNPEGLTKAIQRLISGPLSGKAGPYGYCINASGKLFVTRNGSPTHTFAPHEMMEGIEELLFSKKKFTDFEKLKQVKF